VKNHAADREELLSMGSTKSSAGLSTACLSIDRTESTCDTSGESDRVILFVGATHAVSASRTTSI
jgi:hypothetical protein